jgi:hypothetical protein
MVHASCVSNHLYFRLLGANYIQFGGENILKTVLLGREKELNMVKKVMLKFIIKQVLVFKVELKCLCHQLLCP